MSNSNVPYANSSVFPMDELNAEFALFNQEVTIEIEYEKIKYQFKSKIKFKWLVSPRVEFMITVDNTSFLKIVKDKWLLCKIKIQELNIEVEIQFFRVEGHSFGDKEFIVWAYSNSDVEFKKNSKVQYIKFQLVNFYEFLGEFWAYFPERKVNSKCRNLFEADEFDVILDSVENASEKYNMLQREGGFISTHVGLICKKDHSNFNLTNIESLLKRLYCFFSFLRGSWTPLLFISGYDEEDNLVYQKWNALNFFKTGERIDSYGFTIPIVEYHETEHLVEVFKTIYLLPDDKFNFFCKVLEFYVEGSRNYISKKVNLAMLICGIDNIDLLVNPKSKKKEGIKNLFSKHNYNYQDFSSLNELDFFAKTNNITDGIWAVIEVRNSIIHSDNRIQNNQTIEEAYFLALEYLKTGILFYIEYFGKSKNFIEDYINARI